MSPNGGSGMGLGPGPGIGQALKDARRRLGMDVGEAEERTKIRAKYLRALEAEDWEILPAPAYVRGFLRTYGALLGLDGEMLADEFRRRHEEPAAASPAPEPFLQGRRSSGGRPPSRGPLIAGVALAIVALVVVLGLIGGGDDEPDSTAPVTAGKGGGDGDGKKNVKSNADSKKEPREPVDLVLEPLGSVQVCVVVSGEALIDGQVLAEGAIEEFTGQKRYRVDVGDGGVVRVTSSGDTQKLRAEGDSSWSIDSRGVKAIEYQGPDCP